MALATSSGIPLGASMLARPPERLRRSRLAIWDTARGWSNNSTRPDINVASKSKYNSDFGLAQGSTRMLHFENCSTGHSPANLSEMQWSIEYVRINSLNSFDT